MPFKVVLWPPYTGIPTPTSPPALPAPDISVSEADVNTACSEPGVEGGVGSEVGGAAFLCSV